MVAAVDPESRFPSQVWRKSDGKLMQCRKSARLAGQMPPLKVDDKIAIWIAPLASIVGSVPDDLLNVERIEAGWIN